MRKTLLSLIILFFSCYNLFAQLTISGKVTASDEKSSLPGATVLIKGTSIGTVTDVEGNYQLGVSGNEDILVFSFVGYKTKEVKIGNNNVVDVALEVDVATLEGVVVIGYGSQEKKVVTGSISSIKSKDLDNAPINRIEQALQGRVSGVVIAAASGQPGSGSTVRIRGITSLNDGANDPLWVVDGVVVDNGGIGYLNQSDIESIEVLKDAASQAIYGARAAAGVILVTTKKGKSGKINVSYNGFYGTSAPARKLKLLNAEQYATLLNESLIAAGQIPAIKDPSALGAGTDWQKEIFNYDARRQNHELSISGGGEKSTFYSSFGYWNQNGIVATEISKFTRYSARINSEHKIKKWLTFGENLAYEREISVGIGNVNDEREGILSSAINLDPIAPIVITNPAIVSSSPYSTQPGIITDAKGNPYSISTFVGNEMANPLAFIKTKLGNSGWGENLVGNVYFNVQIIKGLQFRSSLGTKRSYWGDQSFKPVYFFNASNINTVNSLFNEINRKVDYNIENTISYSRTVRKHDFQILLGQGAYRDNRITNLNVTKQGLPISNFNDASLNFDIPKDRDIGGGYESAEHKVTSIFARVNYNYDGRYLFTGVIRQDGSSRFGSNNRFAFFPSGSIGWVVSEESFWPKNEIVNFLKLRGSYGVVGNDNIGDFAYLSTVSGSGRGLKNYSFGTADDYMIGVSPKAPSNPDLKWEQTAQLNVGFESKIMRDLTLTFDWFKKTTSDILINARIPGYVGADENPAANVASMKNSGFEVELGYNKTINGLNINVSGNVTRLENVVTNLGTNMKFLSGGNLFQSSSYPITRTAVGQPINSFYGFKILGIFQNLFEVLNRRNPAGELIQPNAKPGDFIWADLDRDGKITENDRTFIGNPTPKWMYGINISLTYKNFDLSFFGQGAGGNKIFQGLRRVDIANANYESSALNRWTKEGSSTDYPRVVNGDPNKNFGNPSEFYLQKGDYFRIKLFQVGYSVPQKLIDKIKLQKLRFYITSENLLTITKYNGYDPEIGGGTFSIDRGRYPQARSFLGGINLTF